MLLASAALMPSLLVPHSAAAAPAPTQSRTQEELRLREQQAAADLNESSARVRAAAAALRTARARLATAKADVAIAKGKLAGARAMASAARAEADRAEKSTLAAGARVQVADLRVQLGRSQVGRLARRAYQRGSLDSLRRVMTAGDPQDAILRASLLRSVFRAQNDSLRRVAEDRLTLAREEADLASEERRASAGRDSAEQAESRAQALTEQAEEAAENVAALSRRQASALADAEALREQDVRDYQAAQAASRALAERIRQAAARAAAARAANAKRAADAARAASAAARLAPGAGAEASGMGTPQTEPRRDLMLWPAPGRLSSRYGYRTHPIYGDRRMHNGIDIAAPNGTRVSAAEGGVVTFAGDAGGLGNFVVISHRTVDGKDLSTAYAHMESISASVGQLVRRGQKVGGVGNTGASAGNHLHFEVRLDGDPVDPLRYVDRP